MKGKVLVRGDGSVKRVSDQVGVIEIAQSDHHVVRIAAIYMAI